MEHIQCNKQFSNLVTLAQALGKPIDHDDLAAPFALVPDGVDVKIAGTSATRTRRASARRSLCWMPTAFIAYVNRFATTATAVFCNGPEGRTFSAVIDYHQPDLPAWSDHTATYCCPITVEWGRWKAGDRKRMDQATFAEFVEENVKDIVVPRRHANSTKRRRHAGDQPEHWKRRRIFHFAKALASTTARFS